MTAENLPPTPQTTDRGQDTTWRSLAHLFGQLSADNEVRICGTTRYEPIPIVGRGHPTSKQTDVMFVGPMSDSHLPVVEMLNELQKAYPTATITYDDNGGYGLIDVSEALENLPHLTGDTSPRSYFCVVPDGRKYDEVDEIMCAAMPVGPEQIRTQSPFVYGLYSRLDLF